LDIGQYPDAIASEIPSPIVIQSLDGMQKYKDKKYLGRKLFELEAIRSKLEKLKTRYDSQTTSEERSETVNLEPPNHIANESPLGFDIAFDFNVYAPVPSN
jgi:hypothetical protein